MTTSGPSCCWHLFGVQGDQVGIGNDDRQDLEWHPAQPPALPPRDCCWSLAATSNRPMGCGCRCRRWRGRPTGPDCAVAVSAGCRSHSPGALARQSPISESPPTVSQRIIGLYSHWSIGDHHFLVFIAYPKTGTGSEPSRCLSRFRIGCYFRYPSPSGRAAGPLPLSRRESGRPLPLSRRESGPPLPLSAGSERRHSLPSPSGRGAGPLPSPSGRRAGPLPLSLWERGRGEGICLPGKSAWFNLG